MADLPSLAEETLGEARGQHARRAARTLVAGAARRATRIALPEGAELTEHAAPPAATLFHRNVMRPRPSLTPVFCSPSLYADLPQPGRHERLVWLTTSPACARGRGGRSERSDCRGRGHRAVTGSNGLEHDAPEHPGDREHERDVAS